MLTDSSKLGVKPGSKEDASHGVFGRTLLYIPEDDILGTNVGNDEYNSSGESKYAAEVTKEWPELVLKDNIKADNKIWNKVGSIDYSYDRKRVYSSDIYTEGFSVGSSDDATLEKVDIKMLGVADTSKLGR